jgi:hypothetical protein
MVRLIFALAVLPFLAVPGWAAESLNDVQMDQITAGASPSASSSSTANQLPTIAFTCPTCAVGQVFTPSSPQALFSDLVTFLSAVGFQPSQPTP